MMNRRIAFLFLMILGLDVCASAVDRKALTINDYVKTALRQGDHTLVVNNQFQNNLFNYKIGYRSLRLPSLTAGSQFTYNAYDNSHLFSDGNAANGTLSLNQPFYPTGGLITAALLKEEGNAEPVYTAGLSQPLFVFKGNESWRTWRRDVIAFTNAKESYDFDLMSIEMEARGHYYDVVLEREKLAVQRTKLESTKRGYEITKALVNAGRLAGIELSRYDLRLQQDIRDLKNSEIALLQIINNALDYVAMRTDGQVDFTSKLSYQPLTIPLDPLVKYALLHRPDYCQQARNLELSQLSLQETKESNNMDLTANAQLVSQGLNNNYTAGVGVNWPFFDSRVTALKIKIVENQFKNDQINFKSTERNVRTQVLNAFLEIKRMEDQMEDLKKSREQARQSLEAVRVRYQNGRDRLIDVFDSEQELQNLEIQCLEMIINANRAKDNLALLIGGELDTVAK
jgi:outer membrane protein TolC